jgi:biotin operon repressor
MIPLSRILTGQRHIPVVYFARIGSNVKIGTTENLRQRMKAMYVPLENVLAVVPGGRGEETAYHERFKASRVHDDPRRELFRIDPQLRDFLHLGPATAAPVSMPTRALPVVPTVPGEVIQVLLRLLSAPEGTTSSQAGTALGMSKTLAWEHLTALRKQGIAEMTGGGRGSRHRLIPAKEQS